MGFKLPAVFEATTANGVPLFGPSSAAIPAEFTEVPYESFSKSDRALAFPRPADWFSADPAYATTSNGPRGNAQRNARANQYENGPGADEEGTFSLVDKSGTSARSGRGGASGPSLGGSRGGYGARGGRGARGGAAGGRGGYNATGGRGGGFSARGRGSHILRGGFRGRYDQQQRSRTATVQVRSDWQILEEIEFSRLGKLRLDVDTEDPEEVAQYGFVSEYDRSYDRVSTRNPVNLQVIDRVHYNPTTSDDPVIQDVSLFSNSAHRPLKSGFSFLSLPQKAAQRSLQQTTSCLSSCALRDLCTLGTLSSFVKGTRYTLTSETLKRDLSVGPVFNVLHLQADHVSPQTLSL